MNQMSLSLLNVPFFMLYNHIKRKKHYLVLYGFCIAIILVISILLISTNVNAEKLQTSTKHIISIQIEKGDTLWSIASQYITDDYSDMNEYIKEIKKTNGLTTDTIHEGKYLVIPYYAQGE
ncbi:LysM peptidoglycan-binding domain-containing protein [Anaerocolumna sp. AGMB13020]|uniref:cell division suppressor protein YneA n=1 Tax=Anaerocolumna sp. AGMB13020 TaxID=3081750 RepID=UPI002954CF0D|nr:LysM peptidoglycan-binding domain-containing protein [Anaerocolumna sp. AGMB13020]WOO37001.1 LysM peptidoglycan-binding domain-containing protein [Anaerocolumna sp. AGMB13020]